MKYKYRFKENIEAIQFKGDNVADLIELNHFLGRTPDIAYTENKTPYFLLKNENGKINTVHISDFVIKDKENPGSYIIVPYQAFIRLYQVFNYSSSWHEDNLVHSLPKNGERNGMHTLIILLFIFFGDNIKKLSEGNLTDEERKEIIGKFEISEEQNGWYIKVVNQN